MVAELWNRRRWLCYIVLAALIDVVIVGPLIGRGSLLLLDVGDYPQSPHPAFAPSVFGLPPGLTSRAPVEAALYWLFQNIRWAPLHLLPLLVVAPLACIGFARVFPGRGLALIAATLLYTVNPFIYERMADGQLYVVMGYSLLPIILGLVVRPLDSLLATVTLGSLIFTLDIALSIHYLFISGLLLVILILANSACRQKRGFCVAGGITVGGIFLSLYWLIPAVFAARTAQVHVTNLDLSAFRTLGDQRWGLAVNIAGLYGFWRPGLPLAKDYISGWPFLLLAMLIVIGFGIHKLANRDEPADRVLALSCCAFGLAGGLLVAGVQGPTGSMYLWLFTHVPGFKVMREAEKFSSLLALAYAICFGAGIEVLTRSVVRNLSKILCVCCVTALPLVYGYTELWGFDGYVKPTLYPADWIAADRLMAPGATALALPWRAYLQIPWVGNRVVANPAAGYFARTVITADDLEAGSIETETSDPRSLFLQFCLGEGNQLNEFGRLLSPLGIRYIILENVPGASSYNWLNRQHDLRSIFTGPTITVYENEEAVPGAYSPSRQLVVQDWGQVVALAERVPLIDYLIHVRYAHPGPVRISSFVSTGQSEAPTFIDAVSSTPVSVVVRLRSAARTIVFTNPAYAGWHMPNFDTISQFGVTAAFERARSASSSNKISAAYGPWRIAEVCDIVWACFAIAAINLFGYSMICHRRRRRVS